MYDDIYYIDYTEIYIKPNEDKTNYLILMYYYYLNNINLFKKKLSSFQIIYTDKDGKQDYKKGSDAGGLGREFATILATQLLTEKLFIDDKNSEKSQTCTVL
jgi:hypothetical protein